tara:strand:- start:1177 stop:1629 length:453 start_codon:yes stop_codon:yes gene_type:complete
VVVTLETERIEEVVQMMVITVTESVSTTVEGTEMMTAEAEVVAQEVTTVAAVMEAEVEAEMVAEMVAEMAEGLVAEMAEGLVAVQVAVQVVEENLDSIETTVHQRVLVEVVAVVATTNVNLEIITVADESACAASETGFDILQTRNAAYD